MFKLAFPKRTAAAETQIESPIDRYRRIRLRVSELQSVIARTLGRDGFKSSAKALGMVTHKTIVFDSEAEMTLLMDYAIYNHRAHDGLTPVRRYFRHHPAAPQHEDHAVAQAMLNATHRIVRIDRCVPDAGVDVTDVLTRGSFHLTDLSMSHHAAEGGVLGVRTLYFDDMAMTTGAGVPLLPETIDELLHIAETIVHRSADPSRHKEDPAEFSTAVLKAAIRTGATAWIGYQEPK
ncbi:MAG: hypothetical protein ACKVS9_15375 [Phycisphaerae bacterium]